MQGLKKGDCWDWLFCRISGVSSLGENSQHCPAHSSSSRVKGGNSLMVFLGIHYPKQIKGVLLLYVCILIEEPSLFLQLWKYV